jgi:3-oxoacyl-[acyl-carrier protein] reductase
MEGDMLDLGIKGRKAIVCAASKGLGRACAMALGRAGVELVITARTAETLEQTAAEIRQETGAKVTAIAGDITTEAGRQQALAACPEPDILINNAGGPPHGDFREWSIEDWQKAVNANMLTPIMLIKATVDGMSQRKFGRIVNITSGSVKMPLGGLDLSSGARAGLTAFLAGVARSVAQHNVTINFILPGQFLTDRLRSNNESTAKKMGVPVTEVEAQKRNSIPAKRFGDPDEFGAACAFLCSSHAGFITGQNLLIDGGIFPGAF